MGALEREGPSEISLDPSDSGAADATHLLHILGYWLKPLYLCRNLAKG
jgi:hypothetical protein